MAYPSYIITESPTANKYILKIAVDGSLNPDYYTGQPGTDQNPLYVQGDNKIYYRVYINDDLSSSFVQQATAPASGYIYTLNSPLAITDANGNVWYIGVDLDGDYYTAPLIFRITSVSAIQNNMINVNFSVEPYDIDAYNPVSALNPINWTLKDSNNNPVAIADIEIFNPLDGLTPGAGTENAIQIITAVPLLQFMTYTLTASAGIESEGSVLPIHAPLSFNFTGLYVPVTTGTSASSSPLFKTLVQNVIGNDLSYDFSVMDITSDSINDWASETGKDQIKKLITRRLITPIGGFYHLPDYGFNLQPKKIYKTNDYNKLQRDMQRALLQEKGIQSVSVSLSPSADGAALNINVSATTIDKQTVNVIINSGAVNNII